MRGEGRARSYTSREKWAGRGRQQAGDEMQSCFSGGRKMRCRCERGQQVSCPLRAFPFSFSRLSSLLPAPTPPSVTMFEAKLNSSVTLKRILDSIKDLVNEASWDCSPTGMSLQAMDTSHVSLVAVLLKNEGFDKYRCDRNVTLGMNLGSLSKILKCAGNDDNITMRAADDGDKITLTFEAKNETEVSEYDVKLMNLDSEYLGIPDTEYSVDIHMPAAKFQRICKDLGQIGDAVTISCSKNDVRFAASGDLGSGNVRLNQNSSVDNPQESVTIKMQEPICQAFAVKYLNHFAKATPLSNQVRLQMAPDVPLVIEYGIEDADGGEVGHIRYYLAPKIEDDAES